MPSSSENSIAILIPCYNASGFLPELFNGIRAQTVPFNEIICYDDCSTDNTAEVAKELGAKVIKGIENKGPAFGRNRLIEATKCKWVHFHDADDLIDPKFVEIMLGFIKDSQTQLLCNAHVLERNNRSAKAGDINYVSLSETDDKLSYFIDNVGFASIGLYSTSALKTIQGFRENIKTNEDPDLHIRLVQSGFNIENVPHYLVTKLEHQTSFSHQNWMKCLEDKMVCYESYLVDFPEKYHLQIGKHLAWLGSYFYMNGNFRMGKKALILVQKSGLKSIPNTTFFSHWFTLIFGIPTYFSLQKIKFLFKKLF
jgi:glycosyltransferase involved in cell wall biosynthesis